MPCLLQGPASSHRLNPAFPCPLGCEGDAYLHNDLHVREAPADWPGGHAAWVAQEPINAHSHLLSILIGNTQTVPVSKGNLCIGTWQSVLLVELDGPRKRSVGIQVVGQ